jgi:excisionase family DNA binding protein
MPRLTLFPWIRAAPASTWWSELEKAVKANRNGRVPRRSSLMGNTVEVDLATLDAFITEMSGADRKAALALVAGAVADEVSLEAVLAGLQAPALVEVGRRWAAAEIGVSESRAAATLVRAALGRAAPSSIVDGGASVVVGCPDGEAHELEAEMVAEVFRSRGWPAQTVGGNMPPGDLGIFLNRRRPTALIVRCTSPCGLPGAARMIRAAIEMGVPSVAGGSGFGDDSVRAIGLGAAAWATTVDAAIAVLKEWTTTAPALTPVRTINQVHPAFALALPEITEEATATLRRSRFRRRDDADEMASAIGGLDLLLRYLEAALLLDDQRVLLDYLTWMTAYSGDQKASISRLTALLDAIAGEIPSGVPRAGQFIQEGIRHLEWTSRPGSRRVVARAKAQTDRRSDRADAGRQVSTGPEKQQGQVFADLLFLAAVSCHAPMALISVIQPDGQWSTISYGVDRREALNEPDLFAAVAAGSGPIELRDLAADSVRRSSKLANGPLAVRFVCGHPLRTSLDATLGVFCVMDRRARQLTAPEHQAMSAIARQVTNQIILWRRTTAPKPDLLQTAHRRRSSDRVGGNRPGPDAALVDLLGLRRPGSGVEQRLLRSHEVAVLFDVTERTVINWAASRKLPSLRTAGGHLRFRTEDVVALLARRATPGTV